MQERHLFEYAVIRVVPKVEREEFINVGVILYCSSEGFLKTAFEWNEQRLQAFARELNLDEVKQRLLAFERICAGKKEGGPIGQLSLAQRFRWLTAARSTIVQTSAAHPGLCTSATETLSKLYTQLVT